MIDRVISVRQSTVAAISGLHCRALVMVSSSIRLTAWLQNSKKRAERSERLMYEQSHRDYLRSGYLHHRSACHGRVNATVITPLPTKPSATKMPENWSWRTRQLLDTQMRHVMLLRSMAYTKEQLMLKLKIRSAWWCCRWSSSVVSVKQSVSQAWNVYASGGHSSPSTAQWYRWNGIISPSERGWSLCKNNWKWTQKYINEQCRWVAHIDGQLILIVSNYTSSAYINA